MTHRPNKPSGQSEDTPLLGSLGVICILIIALALMGSLAIVQVLL